MEDWDYDYCYECRGYGDDYFINDDGELVSACDDCAIMKAIEMMIGIGRW